MGGEEQERFYYFDRESAQITRERWEELQSDWRYVHLRVTETDRYRVETTWNGRYPASASMSEMLPLPPGRRLIVFSTNTRVLAEPGSYDPTKRVILRGYDTEQGAVKGHDLTIEEAEALYPRRG